ncbi:hypothetical protein K450DRAFT_257968 [Umbelopsis ramanniana AG]|uniref:Tetratricopeptide repeat and J domain-containing co-chaperone DNJ1 n=1 Tax=Umbelopsis ramanniana AG TaxID=1314678 RepID=A0AAD5E2D7_UMBRA|nr:uncharacterized protein K450DRAFT_257968 [Umbelopsis ramanniana AG]KAI8576171.1 hypothetical protein K450DRAFT_257968 [Umbelopsis ramanniana AG]
MKHHRLLLACLIPLLLPVSSVLASEKTTQQYLDDGNKLLVSGKYSEALTSFDAAISKDPANYVSYYRRATTYLSLGRNSAALEDFTTILSIKPDFHQALLQRGKIYAKEGNLDLAKADLKAYVKINPSDADAATLYASVQQAGTDFDLAKKAIDNKDYDECIRLLSAVVPTVPQSTSIRLLRAGCHIAKGEIEEAVGDLTRAAHLSPSDEDVLMKLAQINYYSLYEPQGALSHVKQCLHYDPEQKQCKALFRKLKKLDKSVNAATADYESNKFTAASKKLVGTSEDKGLIATVDEEVDELEQILGATGKMPRRLTLKLYSLACKTFGQKKGDTANTKKWCSATLDMDENDIDALSNLGELALGEEDFEGAVRLLNKAQEATGGQNRRVQELLMEAQKLLKRSKTRDYYKILRVAKDADKREIKKAYRKLAQEWHPDKYSGELGPEAVEAKMAEINQAYEVLYDDDLRQKYDSGQDPYDPTGGQQGGGFHHGGNPFGGGGFHGFPFGDFSGGGGQQFHFKMQY